MRPWAPIPGAERLPIRNDGTQFDAHMDLVTVRDDEGHLLYRVATENDVTEKSLLQAQLLQSQKIESLGILASGIAHDCNNLLTLARKNVVHLKTVALNDLVADPT